MTREFVNLETRCSRCKRLAYTDEFEGEFGEEGYTCTGCVKILNQEFIDRLNNLEGLKGLKGLDE